VILQSLIQQKLLAARKNRNTGHAQLYSTVLAEIVAIGKNNGNRETTDAEALKVVKKFLDGINATLEILKNSGKQDTVQFATAIAEAELLQVLMPKQLTDEELKVIIHQLVAELSDKSDKKSIGKLMGSLSKQFAGQYDGQRAKALIDEALA
jgi:uncharacterized protein YqeY